MLPEEAAIKAAASLLSGMIGAFVLAGSRKRAANVFLAAFLFLLSCNQFAETMRVLQTTDAGRLFWFRIASVFAFLDPLALYYFGSVFPERNRLNSPLPVAAVLVFSVGLVASVGLLELGWRDVAVSGTVISAWAVGTVVAYGAVLHEALRQVREDPFESSYAQLVPALAVITIPALLRAVEVLWEVASANSAAVPADPPVRYALGILTAILGAAWVARGGRRLPTGASATRRLVAVGAWAGGVFAFVANPSVVLNFADAATAWTRPGLPSAIQGGGDALKLFTFGVLASAVILRQRMLDLSLRTRRWASRLLVGASLVGVLWLVASVTSSFGGDALLARPGLLALFVVVLVSTEGFRRLVGAVAEKAYGVPRGSGRLEKIEAYQGAVEQAVEEGRPLGSDPSLRRMREELDLGEQTASVVERMHGGRTGGPLVPGERLEGRYRIEAFQGRGSSGRAFRARDELLDRDVAIKEVLDGSPHESARALREARIAGCLDHPNVITVHDVLHRPGASLLVTEYVERGSLADRLEDEGPLPRERALSTLDGILSGLEAVHAEGIVHGDLKPSNVLVGDSGVPKLSDFGSSRLGNEATRRAGDGLPEGTPAYMAPEQQRGCQPTARSDIYAVALVAEEIRDRRWPEAIQDVLRKARASDPDERFASAAAMREALREAQRTRVTS